MSWSDNEPSHPHRPDLCDRNYALQKIFFVDDAVSQNHVIRLALRKCAHACWLRFNSCQRDERHVL